MNFVDRIRAIVAQISPSNLVNDSFLDDYKLYRLPRFNFEYGPEYFLCDKKGNVVCTCYEFSEREGSGKKVLSVCDYFQEDDERGTLKMLLNMKLEKAEYNQMENLNQK